MASSTQSECSPSSRAGGRGVGGNSRVEGLSSNRAGLKCPGQQQAQENGRRAQGLLQQQLGGLGGRLVSVGALEVMAVATAFWREQAAWQSAIQ